MKSLLTVIVIILLPLSVYGFDGTVKYDMKKSDGSYEFGKLTVPMFEGSWELPNQLGSWRGPLSRFDSKNLTHSSMSLHFFSKENENVLLTSEIECNTRSRKNNELGVVYPKTIKKDKDPKSITYQNTVIVLKLEL